MKKQIAILLSLVSTLGLGGCSKQAASVGIIGGADGPTTIFITSHVNWPVIYALVGVITAGLVALFLYLNKKK